jgi:hypothetical protein
MLPGAAQDPLDPSSAINTPVGVLFYSICATNDLIATKGELSYGNRFTIFAGSADDVALNAGVERIQGDSPRRKARAPLLPDHWGTTPLVTVHNTLDPAVPFRHELNYSALVAHENKSELLTVFPVPSYGHCKFTTEEILGAFAFLVQQATKQTGR